MMSLAYIIASLVVDIINNSCVDECEHWHIHVVVRQGITSQFVIDIFLVLNVDAWLSTVEN